MCGRGCVAVVAFLFRFSVFALSLLLEVTRQERLTLSRGSYHSALLANRRYVLFAPLSRLVV